MQSFVCMRIRLDARARLGFQQIVQDFSSHLDFKRMMIDLYASPIVTGSAETKTGAKTPMVSILRRQQLCALLDERTGRTTVCGITRVAMFLDLFHEMICSRGSRQSAYPISVPSCRRRSGLRSGSTHRCDSKLRSSHLANQKFRLNVWFLN